MSHRLPKVSAWQRRRAGAAENTGRKRSPTATSSFGVGRRENHDSAAFYARFAAPALSDDAVVSPPGVVDQIYVGDSRSMDRVQPASVALVVTSPPYFAGKQYEEELGKEGIPASYAEYLALLEGVFAECVRKLEPGGRIAVNVANLGRKPYRSLSADVIGILQDRLGLLLRGEIIWRKARGAGGNCAWGSFRSPANPVLRDLTERVLVASKGRFDRAIGRVAARLHPTCPTWPRRRPTSSWRPRSTCGSWHPRAPAGSATRRRSRSSSRSGSSSCTPGGATSCSIPSWAWARRRWPPCAPGATTSATTPTTVTSRSPDSGRPTSSWRCSPAADRPSPRATRP